MAQLIVFGYTELDRWYQVEAIFVLAVMRTNNLKHGYTVRNTDLSTQVLLAVKGTARQLEVKLKIEEV